ncbi:hypothetical protein [Bifidobacterium callitrichidarum]|uniref:Uncharacterized protein n=1 Tax=Bifidobacterium callitrichidarum TaxID=2052941 RepID=A0A2U2NC07_9BIFI|nr:hypothetical protein [Bifidobacterium callitrichidarum]PWG66627.1 hypothetical protein DF196_01625 [Bifidobacterium callitrichidarum]
MPENFWENKTINQLNGTTVRVTTPNNTYVGKLIYGVERNQDGTAHYTLCINTDNQGPLRIFTADHSDGLVRPQLDVRIETVSAVESADGAENVVAVETPVQQDDKDIAVITYSSPEQLKSGDLVTLKGVETAFPYDGKTNGRGVRIRIGTGPEPVWVDGRNIDTIIRPINPLPTKQGIYSGADGSLFYLNARGGWYVMYDADSDSWFDHKNVTENTVRQHLPLTSIR